ncbi:MAG: hypothetical protein ACI85U_002523 [Candidatus Promineifilaceae bacterium]|jgi:hypothetical protein
MTLKIPALRIHGKILEELVDDLIVRTVRIDQVLPKKTALIPAGSQLLWLRFGFAIRGTEKPVIPSFVIDDDGNEEHRLRFLEWVYNEGDRYPRSEVFGYEQDHNENWIEMQCFIRELELSLRFFTWVVDKLNAGPGDGLRVDKLGVVVDGMAEPQRMKRPEDWLLPLKRSQATCWALPEG